MAHAQKTNFVFRRNGRVHLNRRGCQFSRLLAAEVCASVVVMLDTPCSEVVWRVLATHCIRQFPLHFPFRAPPCAITFQKEVYNRFPVDGPLGSKHVEDIIKIKLSVHKGCVLLVYILYCNCRPVRTADNLTTFTCWLSWNPEGSTSMKPQGLSRPVKGLLYLIS